jgi:heme oxygenase
MRDRHLETGAPHCSASARLRAETRNAHLAVESTPFANALLSGAIRLEAYVTQLAVYASLHESLEATFDVMAPLRGNLPARRSEMARSDVRLLGGSVMPPSEYHEAISAFHEATRPTQGLPRILGHAYVMEGSALGSHFLAPRVRAGLGLPEASSRYYTGLAGETFPAWARFRAFLDAMLPLETVSESVVAARHAFEVVRAILVTLEPPSSTPDDRRFYGSSGVS